ncbi:hypothetical protein SAV14893_065720 [Streptomyces avermitilis]|uniref:Uncharacterized protein n=1 Tax=Streptomyces avermitilis TaxID=33903 RepID=A0A4D4M696_STRAX|nr:hypothetical protein SAVMC3_78390 [Streptomyces avermitilis]GDY67179.1 hypothetical protein SAV14893_065720 [Streptomyces avermitilis]GDY81674.1 hypothetical protein SAVCW2_08730 [Streptomyces avermitilis]
MRPAGVAIARPGRAPATARVPFAVPPRQSEYEVQARLSTRFGDAFVGRAVGAAAAGPAAPTAATATAAAMTVLRDGSEALVIGG